MALKKILLMQKCLHFKVTGKKLKNVDFFIKTIPNIYKVKANLFIDLKILKQNLSIQSFFYLDVEIKGIIFFFLVFY